jgi:catechol 2,3-dioxygenase-like lactoylglutathione lyase family enzyme
MNPRITLITLGVDDLERAVAFYRDGLGFKTKGIVGAEVENGAVAFFNLESGLKLGLWPRKSLAADSGLPLQAPSSTEFSLAHNVASAQEVDADGAGRACGRPDRQACAAHVLRGLCRLLPGSGRPPLGGGVQPGLRLARLTRRVRLTEACR